MRGELRIISYFSIAILIRSLLLLIISSLLVLRILEFCLSVVLITDVLSIKAKDWVSL